MSAFLGPIHFWLYNKIGNQEKLTKEIADCATVNGWITSTEAYTKTLPPLETEISDAETRYASLVKRILSGDGNRLEALCKEAGRFGREYAIDAETAEAAYKAFEDFFVNGMPCDRVNAVTESTEEKLSWEIKQDIHAQYWNNDSSPYYTIRKRVMEGMLAGTNYKLASEDDALYSIISK